MGTSIAEAGIEPPKYIKTKCRECGGNRKTLNGAWLRFKRLKCGMNQRDFGMMIGFSSPYLSDLETNRRECPASLVKIYNKLDK